MPIGNNAPIVAKIPLKCLAKAIDIYSRFRKFDKQKQLSWKM